MIIRCFTLVVLLTASLQVSADDGYRLWMRYEKITDSSILKEYTSTIQGLSVEGTSPTLNIVRDELTYGLGSMLGRTFKSNTTLASGFVVAGVNTSPMIRSLGLTNQVMTVGEEGFLIVSTVKEGKKIIVITANSEIGVLYGAFHFLRLLQTNQPINSLNISSSPRVKIRILNHWDNLDRTVERGYAGFSLWNWHKLPDYKDQQYIDYARANASIGINATVLTNVNANSLVLTKPYLEKAAALAAVFRPYGIKIYLTARFSAPIELGKLKTADPLDPAVQAWWKQKADEIYAIIPDFGGFLVKANSEGQPGPQNYGRTHVDGANMLADAVKKYNGIVMWRAFVYDDKVPDDRAKQAYSEFKPLDGSFRDNVLVQVKNGPIDFQPREPYHPLFGAMPKTPLMMEFQITQEYLGFSTHLVYLASLFKEALDADTYAKGKNSTVAKVVDGSLDSHKLSGMAGVTNIGNDRNWCGHPFAQANWYAFGRIAWDHTLTPEQIADEWISMTFSNNKTTISNLKSMMLDSRETTVSYMTPLGLHHIMGWGHHYGPGPWIANKQRADWTSVYYHKADTLGIGFNRTESGSNALAQYPVEFRNAYGKPDLISEKYLLWFHHVGWRQKMKSGNTLWDELCLEYQHGVDGVRGMQKTWLSEKGKIDTDRYEQVRELLVIQEKEAVWWRNACLLYFQTFSRMPLPAGVEKPDQTLDYYRSLEFPFAPGN